MGRKYCSTANKLRFPNRLEAELALADIQRSIAHNRHRKFRDEPTRVYVCEFCKDYHLTSRSESRNRRSA